MIVLKSDDPAGLLQAIYDAIDQQGSYGHVKTWGYDKKKNLHHNPETRNNWADKAHFEPAVYAAKNALVFRIKKPQGASGVFTHATYAVYHGRLLQMMISHFANLFTVKDITTKPFLGNWNSYYAAL